MTTSIYIIYKHTSTISKKSYIGQTSRHINVRWKEHLYDSHNKNTPSNLHFHKAIRKYEVEQWTHDIIFSTQNKNIIHNAEKFLIAYHDTYNNGYNSTIGGEIAQCGKDNPFYGKSHSEETKQISRDYNILHFTGKDNPFYDKKHTQETLNLISGKNSVNFIGYYITPNGKFTSPDKDIDMMKLESVNTLRNQCRNSQNIISNSTYKRNKFLQSLGTHVIGETYNSIGFDFIYQS